VHVELHPRFADTAEGRRAKALTSACVHCGFCLTTCPTYADQRDERDSPRGRIYLIKQLLESGEASAPTRVHLDRCLTCRNCETACPSGMEYGELLDIGRELIEHEAPRSLLSRGQRWMLRTVLSRPRLISAALGVAQQLRPVLPRSVRRRIPPRQVKKPVQRSQHARTMLVLQGCVQRAATPNTNAAAQRILDKLGITLIAAPAAGCCGAVNYHLAAHADGLDNMRRNIDAWWPAIENGAEAIVSSATGCGAMLIDYGRLLADDPQYADKARRVSLMTRDLAQVLQAEDLSRLAVNTAIGAVAIHPPCTLQNALQQPQLLHTVLARLGFTLVAPTEKLLCCGSAGTYSILQPAISKRLRATTLRALGGNSPAVIVTANIGCQLHLQAAAEVPVVHWIELLDGY
jgi:glycolate oxidase iron-sulfur subunit